MPTPRLPLSFWFARHPGVVDVVQTLFSLGLALPFLVTTVIQAPEPGRSRALVAPLVLLTLAGTLPLLWRRTAPQTVLIVTTTAAVLATLLASNHNDATPIGPYFALYTLAAYRPRRRSIAGLGFSWLMLGGAALVGGLGSHDALASTLATLALVFGAWAYGRSVGLRRAYMAELEARAEHLQRGRESDLRAVLAEERARIARELHDVVAHHVSVMTVQASAAQRMLDRDVARSREAMAAVELTGRGALTEMRRLVGVLRGPEEAGTAADAAGHKAPQPGLTDIEALVTSVREAGLDVSVTVEGEPMPLSSGMDLAVYRIVQEALTNTLKHAGAARSRVLLRYDPTELMVRVLDDGRGLTPARAAGGRGNGQSEPVGAVAALVGPAGEPPPGPQRTGHGLLGMRERVSLYGGRLYTGPRADGGYEVLARIPLEPRS